jgi:integrase
MLKVSSQKYSCPLFVDDDLSLILLPCLFSYSLIRNKETYVQVDKVTKDYDGKRRVKCELVTNEVTDKTIHTILNRLETFLLWVEKYSYASKELSLFNTEKIPEEMVNHYINDVLIAERGVSETGIFQHIMALNSYFNYLAVNDLSVVKRFKVKSDFRETARDNTKKRTAVKYLTPSLRSTLYQNTSSLRDELLLRSMGELGCRSKECQGFLVDDFTIGGKVYKGLKSLFLEMRENPDKEEFEYYLQGKFSKSKRSAGGESRMLYFHRDLLKRFKDYFDTERPDSIEHTFFLNDPSNGKGGGTPISKSRPSKVFAQVRANVIELQKSGLLNHDEQMLEEDHTGHVLRHSYGTDKFYNFAEEANIRIDDVTTTSSVYLAVARLLGHNTDGRSAPQTTKRYIRSCHIMLQFQAVA